MGAEQINLLGRGIYSYTEASLLLGVSRAKVQAWFAGLPRGAGPTLTSDYADLSTERPLISFLDLMDSCVAMALRKKTSLQTVRKVYKALAIELESAHPFCLDFFVDDTGHQVFLKIANEDGDTQFLELLKRQHAMPEILLPFLDRVEYDPDTRFANRMTIFDRVAIDPHIRFGKPIIELAGMPTSTLYEAYKANNEDSDAVADWYGVTAEDVDSAVRFEEEFSGIAA